MSSGYEVPNRKLVSDATYSGPASLLAEDDRYEEVDMNISSNLMKAAKEAGFNPSATGVPPWQQSIPLTPLPSPPVDSCPSGERKHEKSHNPNRRIIIIAALLLMLGIGVALLISLYKVKTEESGHTIATATNSSSFAQNTGRRLSNLERFESGEKCCPASCINNCKSGNCPFWCKQKDNCCIQ